MQVALSLESLSLELVNKAVESARWVGAQQATAEDAGQEMALAVLSGRRVVSPRQYGKWMALNASNPSRKKCNAEVAFSVVEREELDAAAGYSTEQSLWLEVEEVCTVLEFTCLRGRFVGEMTLQELADANQVSINVVARAIKNALLKLKEVME